MQGTDRCGYKGLTGMYAGDCQVYTQGTDRCGYKGLTGVYAGD